MRRLFWSFPFLWVVLSSVLAAAWLLTTILFHPEQQTGLAWFSGLGPMMGAALGASFYHWQYSLKKSDHAQHQSRLISKTERATLEKTLSDDKIRVLEAKIQTLEMALQQSLKR